MVVGSDLFCLRFGVGLFLYKGLSIVLYFEVHVKQMIEPEDFICIILKVKNLGVVRDVVTGWPQVVIAERSLSTTYLVEEGLP